MRVKLTDKLVQNAKPPKAGRLVLTDSLSGIDLRITEHDARSWSLRVWTGPVDNRVQRRVTLGYPRERDGAPTLSLAQARAAAREVRVAAAEGRSLVPGDGIRGAQTFAQLANEYIAWVEGQRRPVTVAEIGRVLRHRDLAEWRDRPAVRITTDDVSSPRCDPRARAGHGDARPADHQWIGHVGGE